MRLYNLTEKKEYLDFAEYIVENGVANNCNLVELAFENEIYPYQYPVVKAYEIMSFFEGLIEYYRFNKNEKYKIAVDNFAKKLIESEITVIGCAGCEHELFNSSQGWQKSAYD